MDEHTSHAAERRMSMGKYRKKPVVIDAFKLGVDNMPDWFMDSVTANKVVLHGTSSGFYHADDTNADIYTLEGWHHANYGDYIIRGVKGELYPCKPDIFDMTYDMVYQPKTNADRDEIALPMVDDAPTVDAVEVVRCKDCVWCRYSAVHDVQWCDHESGLCDAIVGNEFCSYGERRNNEPEKPV